MIRASAERMLQPSRPLAPTAGPAHLEHIDEHLVTLRQRSSPEAEQYNSLRFALEARTVDALRAVAITSPAAGDGKTTTAINLAGALAHRREARVLIVDVDLRRPSVGPLLGLDHDGVRIGLVDAILDPDLTLAAAVTHLPAFNLSVLPAGRFTDEPFELLRTQRMKDLLQEARQQYDFVVLDTSPLLLFPDARILEHWVDAVLLVVAAHRTQRKLVEEAVKLLSPAKLVGLVFNGDSRPMSQSYGDSYGYGYVPSRPGAPRPRSRWP